MVWRDREARRERPDALTAEVDHFEAVDDPPTARAPNGEDVVVGPALPGMVMCDGCSAAERSASQAGQGGCRGDVHGGRLGRSGAGVKRAGYLTSGGGDRAAPRGSEYARGVD